MRPYTINTENDKRNGEKETKDDTDYLYEPSDVECTEIRRSKLSLTFSSWNLVKRTIVDISTPSLLCYQGQSASTLSNSGTYQIVQERRECKSI